MKNRFSEDSSYLIGGAILGAAAMYLLDPDVGDRRRRRIATAAEGAYGTARRTASSELKHVSDRAKDLTHRLLARAHHVQGDAAGYAQNLADEARGIADDLTNRANSFVKDKQAAAQDHGRQAYDDITHRAGHLRDLLRRQAQGAVAKTRSLLGREELSHHYAGWTSGAVGALALGAGLMYFFDPSRGGARRARVNGMVADCIHNTGQIMRGFGSRVSNSARAARDRARSVADRTLHGEFGGEELISRAREAVAPLVTEANRIQFLADRDGTITVTGAIAREAMEKLLYALHRVPGVSHVINRLEIRENAQHGVGVH